MEGSGISEAVLIKVRKLNDLAYQRGQSLAQMSLAWVLKDPRITSVIIGASKPQQVVDCVNCLGNTDFSNEELNTIDIILKEG